MKPNEEQLREQIVKDLKSPHSTVGLLLNSELAFPKKGETAGSMKERLIPHITDYIISLIPHNNSLLQAELNWITAQIERGDERLRHWEKLHDDSMPNNTLIAYHADSCIRAITNFLAPLIERKKELEKLLEVTQ